MNNLIVLDLGNCNKIITLINGYLAVEQLLDNYMKTTDHQDNTFKWSVRLANLSMMIRTKIFALKINIRKMLISK